MSGSSRTHDLQHARLPCPSLSAGVCSDSCPLSQWCYLNISSYAALHSFHLQSFPASRSFPVSQLFGSGGQSKVEREGDFLFCFYPGRCFCKLFSSLFITFSKAKEKGCTLFLVVFGFSYYTGKKKWKMWLYNPSGEFL